LGRIVGLTWAWDFVAIMKAQLSFLRDYATENLWVIPSLLTAGAIALSFALIALDRSAWGQSLANQDWVYPIDPPGARLTLSTLAGSMITVTSLVFSLTILALTVAAQQLGPRLLRSFVRDRATQVVLGVFVSTFVFALLVLRAVKDTDGADFVPYLSLAVALVLAITSLGALIYFMHHIAKTIQADTVIANVTDDLHEVLARTFPLSADRETEGGNESDAASVRASVRENGRAIEAGRGGYIQIIDYESLLETAVEKNLSFVLPSRSGHFVISNSTLALAAPADAVNDELVEAVRDHILIGARRTPARDPEFLIANLVEIAVRALSAGVNDHYTATACVDRLCEALAEILRRPPLPSTMADRRGTVRLVRDSPTFAHLLDSAFNEIRQSAPGNVAVLSRVADRLVMLGELAKRPSERQALHRHAGRLRETAQNFVVNQDDRERIVGPLAAFESSPQRAGATGQTEGSAV